MRRVVVSPQCATPCPSCAGCRPGGSPASLEQVLTHESEPGLVLGGGDAASWPELDAFLQINRGRRSPQRVWIEAPARALGRATLSRLASGGVSGVVVQIEAVGERWIRALGVADGEEVIREAESVGLETQARVCVRPKTFPMVVPLARRLAPRRVWLELLRCDWGKDPVHAWPAAVEGTVLSSPNLFFSAHRTSSDGYLPPCALPRAWARRPEIWRATLLPGAGGGSDRRNDARSECGRCSLASTCQWNDPGALPPTAELEPPAGAPPWERVGTWGRSRRRPLPAAIAERRRGPSVICVKPWTTMEIVDVRGRAHQCCSTWTVGDRGDLTASPLLDVWNGDGYRMARRVMASSQREPLCRPICPRLTDGKDAETHFDIVDGSDRFVQNQLAVAEDIAERREEARGRPLYLAVAPSTYCNYDCIMCIHGRTPRRDLPEEVWEQLPELLPTLRVLSLLGGEPLALPRVMSLLRALDCASYPDLGIDVTTNGSLLGEKSLARMRGCPLGDVTVSLNAGTSEVYEAVQRGLSLDEILANVDALVRYRAAHPRWFGISLSFVVQPANAHTLEEFGEIADARNLRIRLLPLNARGPDGLDYYDDADQVARIVEHLDRFASVTRDRRPEWQREIVATRNAIAAEGASRASAVNTSTRLPILR